MPTDAYTDTLLARAGAAIAQSRPDKQSKESRLADLPLRHQAPPRQSPRDSNEQASPKKSAAAIVRHDTSDVLLQRLYALREELKIPALHPISGNIPLSTSRKRQIEDVESEQPQEYPQTAKKQRTLAPLADRSHKISSRLPLPSTTRKVRIGSIKPQDHVQLPMQMPADKKRRTLATVTAQSQKIPRIDSIVLTSRKRRGNDELLHESAPEVTRQPSPKRLKVLSPMGPHKPRSRRSLVTPWKPTSLRAKLTIDDAMNTRRLDSPGREKQEGGLHVRRMNGVGNSKLPVAAFSAGWQGKGRKEEDVKEGQAVVRGHDFPMPGSFPGEAVQKKR